MVLRFPVFVLSMAFLPMIFFSPESHAQNERIIQEMGIIGFAAQHCRFPLTSGYSDTREELRNSRISAHFNRHYDIGFKNGQSAALLGGNYFCTASCLAHGPSSPSPRKSFIRC